MAGLFGKLARAVFGKQAYDPRTQRAERDLRGAAEKATRASKLAARAMQGEALAREHAARAARAAADARRRGDPAREQQAQREERQALEAATRQRQERLDQERREREARQLAEQAVLKREELKAKAREALLRTRKNVVERGEPWPFAGPAPKRPKQYANVNEGAGELPDVQAFLMGQKYTAFASSNVVAVQFDPRHGGDLYIQYKKKGFYCYPRVGAAFALSFLNVPSKGIHVHDVIRVRGENPRLPSPPASTRKTFIRGKRPPADLPLKSSSAAFAAGGGGI